VVRPLAHSDSTISSTQVSHRCRFLTICGSNVPSRSRGLTSRRLPRRFCSGCCRSGIVQRETAGGPFCRSAVRNCPGKWADKLPVTRSARDRPEQVRKMVSIHVAQAEMPHAVVCVLGNAGIQVQKDADRPANRLLVVRGVEQMEFPIRSGRDGSRVKSKKSAERLCSGSSHGATNTSLPTCTSGCSESTGRETRSRSCGPPRSSARHRDAARIPSASRRNRPGTGARPRASAHRGP
jgi:hypothetical protein